MDAQVGMLFAYKELSGDLCKKLDKNRNKGGQYGRLNQRD